MSGFHVACVQFDSKWGDPEHNMNHVESMLNSKIGRNPIDMILLPGTVSIKSINEFKPPHLMLLLTG